MNGQSLLIAVIDDDAGTLKALLRLLQASTFDTVGFSDGRSFLGALGERTPDCAIVDLQMPDLNGLDILRALSARERSVPVIVITAHDELGMRAKCLAAGARAYLSKPVDEADLLQAIAGATHGTKIQ